MAIDLIIRGGTIVDGTGSARFTGDVGVHEGEIVAVGRVDETARREIEADGLLVTPGFVDIHTHYDGQATWDGVLAPSAVHGVTSIVMGNCGVGFAPAQPGEHAHEQLISLMEGVEDIPGTALAEGLAWDWRSFPDFLDALARRRRTIDVGAYVPHASLRAYVMGERGANHTETPTEDEIAEMARLVEEALGAGAMGFSTSRTSNHRARDGRPIGSFEASERELLGIVDALRRTQRGVVQVVSDFDVPSEIALIRHLARVTGRPVTTSLAQVERAPTRWRAILDELENAARDGLDVSAQICLRPTGMLLGLETSMNPFMLCPTFAARQRLPLAERVAELARPEVRAAVLAEHGAVQGEPLVQRVTTSFERLFRLGDPPRYEPDRSESLTSEARRRGATPQEIAYDALLEDGGRALLYFPLGNYVDFNLDAAAEMFRSPVAVFGLSDGGAHVAVICDASFPTFHLTHWCRDRAPSPTFTIEEIVHAQTQRTARAVGWHDRGVLAPGFKADLNLIDFDGLSLLAPRIVRDLPAGGRRLLQDARGYVATVCSGEVTFEHGEATGARPGAVVRGSQPAPR